MRIQYPMDGQIRFARFGYFEKILGQWIVFQYAWLATGFQLPVLSVEVEAVIGIYGIAGAAAREDELAAAAITGKIVMTDGAHGDDAGGFGNFTA